MQIPKRSIQKKSSVLDTAQEYLEKGQEVPRELIDEFSGDPGFATSLALKYFKFKKEVPRELIDEISKDPESATDLAREYVRYNKEIPRKLFNAVLEDPDRAGFLAREHLKYNKEVPPNLVIIASKSPWATRSLALGYLRYNKKVPQELIDTVSKDPWDAWLLAYAYISYDKNVPQELVDTVSENPKFAEKLAREYLKYNKEIPQELINAVLKDSLLSHKLAEEYIKHNKEVPQELSSNLSAPRSVDILTKEELTNLLIFINNGAVQLPKSIEDLPKKLQKQYSSLDDPKLQKVLLNKIPENLKKKMKELNLPVELESLLHPEIKDYIEKSVELQHLPSFLYTAIPEDRTQRGVHTYYSEPQSGKHGRVYVHAPELPKEITKVFDLHKHDTSHFIGWIAWFENTLEDGRKVFQIWEIQSDLLQGTQQLDLKQYGKGKPILDEQGELIEDNIDPQYSVERVKEIKNALAKYKQEHGKSLKNVLENQYRNWPALFLNEAFKEAKRLGYEWVGIELIHQNRPDLKKVYEYVSHYPVVEKVKTRVHNPESRRGTKVDVALLKVDQMKTASKHLMKIARLIKSNNTIDKIVNIINERYDILKDYLNRTPTFNELKPFLTSSPRAEFDFSFDQLTDSEAENLYLEIDNPGMISQIKQGLEEELKHLSDAQIRLLIESFVKDPFDTDLKEEIRKITLPMEDLTEAKEILVTIIDSIEHHSSQMGIETFLEHYPFSYLETNPEVAPYKEQIIRILEELKDTHPLAQKLLEKISR